jgi:hypothetical protein
LERLDQYSKEFEAVIDGEISLKSLLFVAEGRALTGRSQTFSRNYPVPPGKSSPLNQAKPVNSGKSG